MRYGAVKQGIRWHGELCLRSKRLASFAKLKSIFFSAGHAKVDVNVENFFAVQMLVLVHRALQHY